MGSRIMHYAVAHIIAETIKVKDRERFVLGNLEPDLSSKADGSYTKAHFEGENIKDNTRGIDWARFANQYQDSILYDDEILGYLVHLITDACWLKLIRNKHI